MKAKKLLTLGLGAVAALALAGCGGQEADNLEARQKAVKVVSNQGICTSGGDDLIAGTESRLEGPATLSLLKQSLPKVDGKQYTVTIDWSYDEATYGAAGAEGSVVKKWQTDYNDENRMFVSFNWSTEEDLAFAIKGVISCGEGASAEVAYSFVLGKMTMVVDDMTHAQYYETDAAKTYFKNWQGSVGGNKYKYDNKHYIHVAGKITYLSPDKNFGYFENGDLSLYLYRVDADDEPRDTFEVGKYFEFATYCSSYLGSPQISNYLQINELQPTDSKISEPTQTVTALTGKQMAGTLGTDPERINQFSNMHHRMASLTGRFKAGSIAGPGASTGKNRFTFVMTADDGTEVTIAHNYHVDKKTGSIGKPILDKLNGLTDGQPIKVTGRLSYAQNGDASEDAWTNSGAWQLVPMTAEAVEVAN